MGTSSSAQTVPEAVKLQTNPTAENWTNSTTISYDSSISDDMVRAEVQKAFESGFSAGLQSHKEAVKAQVYDENNTKIQAMQKSALKMANETVSLLLVMNDDRAFVWKYVMSRSISLYRPFVLLIFLSSICSYFSAARNE